MSFVAQPYQRFVADLLTGLTGGVTREENVYTGPSATYSLGAHDALPSTIEMFGQRSQAFATFTRGVDYDYVPGTGSIVWKQGGRPPDDHSYFYVTYYRREVSSNLTDRNAGSVTATLAEAFARELAVLHLQMERIYESGFVELATGTSLDHVVALMGLIRKDPKFATGEVSFKRSTPAPGDVAIPAGTILANRQGQTFETTDKRTLRKGQLVVNIPIRAQVEGPAGNVDPATITILTRPIFGIESVVNEAKTAFAAQTETDDELRRRLQATLERAGKSTVDAIKYALIENVPEISDANIQLTEMGDGLVDLKIGIEARGDPTLAGRIDDAVFSARAAGIRVQHNIPAPNQVAPSEGITRTEAVSNFGPGGQPPGTKELPGEVLDAMPDGVLNLRIEVFLRLQAENPTPAQRGTVEDAVRKAVRDYITALPMGADLVFSKLLGQVVTVDGVADVAMIVGAEGPAGYSHYDQNLRTSGRKASIDDPHIYVGLMDQRVDIDLTVVVAAQHTEANVEKIISADGELYGALQRSLGNLLATTQDVIRLANLQPTVVSALNAYGLQLAETRGVVLNATYREMSRLLTGVDQVPLEEQEVPVLNKLVLKQTGPLDV